jgi:hypothetical protein
MEGAHVEADTDLFQAAAAAADTIYESPKTSRDPGTT